MKFLVFWISLIAGMGFIPNGHIHAGGQWFASVYGGRFSDNALLDILRFQTNIKDSSVYVLSVGKELGRFGNKIAYEVEGQLGIHQGLQSHEELNAAFALRWLPIPWDRYIDTSVAIGNGLSYATAEPPLEKMEQKDNKASQWLYYIYAEMAFEPYKDAQWNLFVRVHHRSGIFGLVNGIDSGSNFIGIGVRLFLF